jgi:hypothetical protein
MTQYRRLRRAIGRRTLLPPLLAIMVGTVAACDEAAPSNAPPSANPAASATRHMISNEGHKLAFYVTPGRLPAIVLDSGGGLDGSYWNTLVPTLARDTGSEIITYDRAGLGASDEVPGPWKIENAVSDLDAA